MQVFYDEIERHGLLASGFPRFQRAIKFGAGEFDAILGLRQPMSFAAKGQQCAKIGLTSAGAEGIDQLGGKVRRKIRVFAATSQVTGTRAPRPNV